MRDMHLICNLCRVFPTFLQGFAVAVAYALTPPNLRVRQRKEVLLSQLYFYKVNVFIPICYYLNKREVVE